MVLSPRIDGAFLVVVDAAVAVQDECDIAVAVDVDVAVVATLRLPLLLLSRRWCRQTLFDEVGTKWDAFVPLKVLVLDAAAFAFEFVVGLQYCCCCCC